MASLLRMCNVIYLKMTPMSSAVSPPMAGLSQRTLSSPDLITKLPTCSVHALQLVLDVAVPALQRELAAAWSICFP